MGEIGRWIGSHAVGRRTTWAGESSVDFCQLVLLLHHVGVRPTSVCYGSRIALIEVSSRNAKIETARTTCWCAQKAACSATRALASGTTR